METQRTYRRTAQEGEELPTGNEIHHHVQIRGILKGTPKVDDEGMLDCLEERFFIVGMLHLLGSNYLGLAQDFNCIEAKIVLASDYTEDMNGRQAHTFTTHLGALVRNCQCLVFGG